MVADLLAAGDQLLVVAGGGEEAAALGVAEAGDGGVRQRLGLLEPALLEARFVERQQRLQQEGVVLEVGVEAGVAVLVGAQQVPVLVAQRVEDELRAPPRGGEVVLAAEDRARLGEGADRQGVPGGEALVVELRPDAIGTRLVEGAAGLGKTRWGALFSVCERKAPRGAAGQVEDVGALEVALLADAVELDHGLGAVAEHGADLCRRPDVEAPLLALGVGVESRVEAALGPAHLPQHPVQRLLAGAAVALVAQGLPAVQVGAGQQGVVVEHLLEVGDQPDGVDRVTREAAAELVVDAAGQHRVEGDLDRLMLAAGQQQLQRRGRRELGGAAEAAVLHVGGGPQPRHGVLELARLGRLAAWLDLADRAEPGPRLRRALADLLALALEGVDHGFHHHPEARHAAALVGWEVGAAIERHALGVEEDGHRPAAVAAHRLHRLHVDGVDVGPLLAIDLDADEVLVHVGGGLRVLEGLALHHVAPVAGGVADGEQDRPVLLTRPGQGLRAPGVPVDRVLAVLEEVRAGLLGEPVGHLAPAYL